MQGYFSRIAKQSGLRILAQDSIKPTHARLSTDQTDAPLEREITVNAPKPSPDAGFGSSNILKEPGIDGKPMILPTEGMGIRPGLKDLQPGTHIGPSLEIASQSIGGIESNQSGLPQRLGSEADWGSEVKVSPFPDRKPLPLTDAKLDSPSTQPFETGSSVQPLISDPDEPKQYFSRTAAILETGKAVPADVQAMVLRDVREWVADPQQEEVRNSGNQDRVETNSPRNFSRARTAEAKPLRVHTRPEPAEDPEPLERNFELSIGTISVVIEQPETPEKPVPHFRSPANPSGPDRAPRTSRLSRSYL